MIKTNKPRLDRAHSAQQICFQAVADLGFTEGGELSASPRLMGVQGLSPEILLLK